MANSSQTARISGYLEKKAKLRLGSPWKKYWFVLEGRLLLYYRSKDEYEALSPCKGSINLCPPCNIKPTQSVTGVFQIECRAHTIILRADDRSQQEKWMQALLAGIDQTTCNANRMSHFRYSLDDLPIPTETNKKSESALSRQNTMPYRTSSSPKKESKDIIERLQLIGAQSYRVSLGTINKFKKREDTSQSIEQIPGLVDDQYSVIQEENSIEMFLEQQTSSNNSSTCLNVDNEHYSPAIEASDKAELTNTIENTQYSVVEASEMPFIRNQEAHNAEHLYERISKDSYMGENQNEGHAEKINEEYSTTEKNSEPVQESMLAVIIDNDQYVKTVDNANNRLPSGVEYIEYDAIDRNEEQEGLYEDPDRLKKKPACELEPLLPPRPNTRKYSEDTSSQASSNEDSIKKKCRSLFRHLRRTDKKCDSNENHKVKLKPKGRSGSFLKRVWRRKAKSLDSQEDVNYETIDYEHVHKQIQRDRNDIQMLQQLQEILESRKNILQEKLKAGEERAKGVTDCSQIPVSERKDDNAETNTVEAIDENKPLLPPKQNMQSPPDSKENTNDLNENQVKSIDEILQELEETNATTETHQNVKKLINKFNEFQTDDDDVVLRKKSKPQLHFIVGDNVNRNSEGLSKLLEELSKVTCAPVLTPGVTSSLVTPILTDDEWLELMPIRRRRMSDPDYDVPRSHRSLQLQGRAKLFPDNPIPATRFFGPILSSDRGESLGAKSNSMIDPDSLEVAVHNIKTSAPICYRPEKEYSSLYFSHNYHKHDGVVYAQPKSLIIDTHTSTDDASNKNNDTSDNLEILNDKISTKEEIFIDSLEPLVEVSTAF